MNNFHYSLLILLITMVHSPSAQQDDQQTKTSIVNSIGMEMVLVQPGTFQVGSTDSIRDDVPRHSITLTKPFYIGKCEVTQKEWRDVMGNNPSKYQGDDRPVTNVSWDDAQRFIQRLNEKEGKTIYRLPTEAEWQFAARGGTHSKGYIFSGSNNMTEVAVCSENSAGEIKPVGTKRPNELGIYDMSGNVFEWCSDWYGARDRSDVVDPKGPTSGKFRILRGGAFDDDANRCRVNMSKNYLSYIPSTSFSYIGFRCVRDTL